MDGSGAHACAHCGLPVPPALVEAGADEQFCCAGCATVYRILHDEGLEPLYQRTREEGAADRRAARSFEAFDDPTFLSLHSRSLPGGALQIELYLEGVHCAACLWLLEKLPKMVDGVRDARLDFARAMLSVTFDPTRTALSQIGTFLDRLGYAPHPYRDLNRRAQQRDEERRLLVRIAIAGAVAGNVMLIAFALYGGAFEGMSRDWRDFFRWVSLALSIPAVLFAGSSFFVHALASLRARTLHMDLPIALGISAGFIGGVVNTIRGVGEVYFDSVTTLIFLLLVGRFLQQRQQRQAVQATELLYNLAPATARRIDADDNARDVPIEALQPRDRIEVRPGEVIPADGVVQLGRSSVEMAILTGESRPVAVGPRDAIHAGCTNLSARLVVEIRETGAQTRLGKLLREVEELARRRAPVVQLVDRISGWFVAAVLLLASVTALVWALIDPALALEHSIALLIVCCPCALGLATPLAITAALGRAARAGVLVKGGDTLEALTHPGTLFLDKTGTLTSGRMALVEWWGDETVRPLVRAAEAESTHPLAQALVRGLAPRADPSPSLELTHHLGRGIEGRDAGGSFAIGSAELVRSSLGRLPDEVESVVRRFAARALTPVVIARGSEAVAVAAIGDPIRPDARETIDAFRQRGWRVGILSGDHADVVSAIAAELELDPALCRGGLSPEEKARAVEAARTLIDVDEGGANRTASSLSRHAPSVVMVGDGVNDAAALSAATVGVGVHGGAEASLAVADIFFSHEGLGSLRALLFGAERTMRVIRRNLSLSLVYNLVGASLAVGGLLTPVVAAILMPLSSLTVVFSSYRARTFEPRDGDREARAVIGEPES
ncbi:MAG: heavy metal translocating P-type ATPase [Myxococcales bacterium]|nr:heavy metal translocating P-type ATPase [Myxococcales bacterium]